MSEPQSFPLVLTPPYQEPRRDPGEAEPWQRYLDQKCPAPEPRS